MHFAIESMHATDRSWPPCVISIRAALIGLFIAWYEPRTVRALPRGMHLHGDEEQQLRVGRPGLRTEHKKDRW